MKVTIKEMKPTKAVVHISETTPYFVNSLRRIMVADLPKLSIHDVIIYDNTSPLFDEIISHRLSLIPLPTDLDVLNYREDCSCKGKGCPSCTVRYTLSKEGEGMVYSKDLQPEEKSWAITEENIPIVELSKDQRIILEVEAILGQGKTHAKWQAIQAAGYKYYPMIDIDLKKCDGCQECVKRCPQHILELKNDKLTVTDLEKCTLCQSCVEVCEPNAITVEGDPTQFLFRFETDGSLAPETVLHHASVLLQEKYHEFGEAIKKIK